MDHGNKIVMSNRIVLDPKEIIGKSIAIMGTNGSGKSGTTRRLAEEMLRNHDPFAIVDIENEFVTLKELGSVILAGPPVDYGAYTVDIPLTNSTEYNEFGRKAYEDSLVVVLLLGDLDDEARKLFLKAFLDGIFEAANNPKTAHPYRVFIEEVQEYIPQMGLAKSDPLRQTIIRFGKRGRKRKLSMVLISQRPSNVDKDVLTQCHLFFAHFVTWSTDIEVYKNALSIVNCEDKMKMFVAGDVVFIFGKQYIEDKITKPKTISPWDESSAFDTANFIQVDSVTEIREQVQREGRKDQGMTVVPTATFEALQQEVELLKNDTQVLINANLAQEEIITALKKRPAVSVRDDATETTQEIIADLTLRVSKAEVALSIVDMLAQFIRQETPNG